MRILIARMRVHNLQLQNSYFKSYEIIKPDDCAFLKPHLPLPPKKSGKPTDYKLCCESLKYPGHKFKSDPSSDYRMTVIDIRTPRSYLDNIQEGNAGRFLSLSTLC